MTLTHFSSLRGEMSHQWPIHKVLRSPSLSAACSRAVPAGRERSVGVAAGAARSPRIGSALLGRGARPCPAPAPGGAAAAPPRDREATSQVALPDRQNWDLEGPMVTGLFVCFVVGKLFVVTSRKCWVLFFLIFFFFCLRFPSNFQFVLPKSEMVQLFPDVKCW